MRDTFDKDEIFSDNDQFRIFNSSLYLIDEIRGVVFVRCFMVCSVLPLTINTCFNIPFEIQHQYKCIIGFPVAFPNFSSLE